MMREHERLIARWLGAESRAADTESEAALSALLRHLPYATPSEALVVGVMQRIGSTQRRVTDLPVAWRFGFAVAMLLVAIAAGWLPAALLALPSPVGGAVSVVASLVAATAEWMAGGLWMWRLLVTLGDKAALLLATPESAAALVASILLSAASLRLLHGLSALDRRPVGAE